MTGARARQIVGGSILMISGFLFGVSAETWRARWMHEQIAKAAVYPCVQEFEVTDNVIERTWLDTAIGNNNELAIASDPGITGYNAGGFPAYGVNPDGHMEAIRTDDQGRVFCSPETFKWKDSASQVVR